MICEAVNCSADAVSGTRYCEDHVLANQVAAHQRSAARARMGSGTLADLINRGKSKGLITPQMSEYAHLSA